MHYRTIARPTIPIAGETLLPARGAAQLQIGHFGKIDSAPLRHFSANCLNLVVGESPLGDREDLGVFEMDMRGIQIGQLMKEIDQALVIRLGERSFREPALADLIDLAMGGVGRFVIGLQAVESSHGLGDFLTALRAHLWEKRVFFVARVPRRGLAKVAQRRFEGVPVVIAQRAALSLIRHEPELLKEPLDPPVTVAEQADRVVEAGIRLAADGQCH